MATSNNVTAPNEGDEAKKPEKSALQTFLDGLVIPSIEFIVSIFDGTADIDNEAIEHFRSPFVYGGKDSNDLRLLVKTPKLAESVWNVFAVLPAVLPLLNEKGEIVGIASLLVSRTNQNAGVGIAIRADIAKKSLVEMLATGKVERPALGVMIIPLYGKANQRDKIFKDNPSINTSIPNTFGLMISDKNKPDNPLPKGLQAWDTIIGINDIAINNDIEFAEQLGKYKIGDTVSLNILRDKRFIQVDNITLKVFPVPTKLFYGDRPQKIQIPNKKKN